MRLVIVTQVVDKTHPILGFFHTWIETFAKSVTHLDVICLYEGVHDLPKNVEVHSLGKEAGEGKVTYLIRFYRYFFRVVLRRRAEVVFYHMGGIFNIIAAPFFLLRFVTHTKYYWWKTHGHIDLTGRIALMCVDRVYTAIEESFPINTKKRHVVGHAIDTTLFTLGAAQKRGNTILFCGRISRAKRIEQVVQIARRLRERGRDCVLKIIGSVADEGYYRELQLCIKELGMEKYVEVIEGVEQEALVREYQRAGVFINPSDNDGLDKVVLEAMACGAIPLSANVSFNSILSPHNLYLQKGDINGYVEAAEKILNLSDTEYDELSETFRSVVTENHSMHTLPDRLEISNDYD